MLHRLHHPGDSGTSPLLQGQREIKVGDVIWELKGSDRRYGVIRSCSWAPGHSGGSDGSSSSSKFESASWHVQRVLHCLHFPGGAKGQRYTLHGATCTA